MAKHNLFIHEVPVLVNNPSIQTRRVPLMVVEELLAEVQSQRRGDWLRPDLWPCALMMIRFFPSDPQLIFVTASFPNENGAGKAAKFRLDGVFFEVDSVPRIGEVSFAAPGAALLLGTEEWGEGLMLRVSKTEDGTSFRAELSWKKELELEESEKILIAGLNLQDEVTARIGEMVFDETDMLLASFQKTEKRGKIVTAVIYFAAGESGLLDFIS